jgi:pyruvate/2-oxoglutarate dehydrogenase complex dihydrolipoamide acyltransferase (E2) component
MKQEKTTILRKMAIYGFEAVAGSHNFYGLLDFDITKLRSLLRESRSAGTGGSLFSFLLKAIGKCLSEYPELNSMIDLKRTTTFDEVDIAIPIEIVHEGKWATKQYVIRNINDKTLKQIDDEINDAKRNEGGEKGYVASSLVQKLIGILPKRIVLFLFRYIMKSHERVKDLSGTVFVTSVSMFSNIPGYVIPFSGGPKAVSFAIGSSMKKPVVKGDEILIREILNITVIFNHDIVDGAPAARFINQLRKYIEVNYRDLM